MPKFSFITLGCKVNQYDAQAMREAFLARGYEEALHREPADIYVVNTCTVTGTADSKSARAIRRLLREHPWSRVVVAGCGVDASASYLDEFGERVLCAGNAEKLCLPDVLEGRGSAACETWASGIAGFSGHTRAFVKVQDGCNGNCTYCIVPRVRGASRLRPAGEALEEIRRLVDGGFREVVLTGIHLGRHDDLPRIIRGAARIDGLLRLRLSSIEALEVNDALLDAMLSSEKICPHLHLPLQSGSDDVLDRMNRPYTSGKFLSAVERVRKALPDPALTTDVIVGFPGETEADFNATISVCRRSGFSRFHVFRYSDRGGTPASKMRDKCGPHVVVPRIERLKVIASEMATEYHQRIVGQVVDVLVEHRRDRETKHLTGLTGRYVRVLFEGPDALMGQLVPVEVTQAHSEHVAGKLNGASCFLQGEPAVRLNPHARLGIMPVQLRWWFGQGSRAKGTQ